jgi:cytochrome c oxidase subunit 2
VREINDLHVPVGQPVRITMTSQDVIHSLYIPAFRIKADVIPGRYTTLWFKPTKPGAYHIFCAEYCGTEHSKMGGTIYVLERPEYDAWLATGQVGPTMQASGEQLFAQLACNTCHRVGEAAAAGLPARAPSLEGLFGTPVTLTSGRSVVVDEGYVRESILNPKAKIVQGWQPIMPTYQGQVSEEQLNELVVYIKNLGSEAPPEAAPKATDEVADRGRANDA